MGFRFRRSISLIPGVRVNLGKHGASLSIGGRGAHVNFSKRGTRTTLSAPGTGLSYTTTSSSSRAAAHPSIHHTAADAPGTAHVAPAPQVSPAPKAPSLGTAVWHLITLAFMVAVLARVVWLVLH